MGAKASARPFVFFGIGALSAGTLFVLHRLLISEQISAGPSTFAPPEPARLVEPGGGPLSDEPAQALVTEAGRAGGDEEARVAADTGSGPAEQAANAENPHIEALRHPSPVYRNASLTMVIRAAGHVCTEVLSATAGTDDLATLRVSCDGARAYLVWEDGAGGLRVEPMAYFDEPTPHIVVPDEPPVETTPIPRPLEPLRLVPPPPE